MSADGDRAAALAALRADPDVAGRAQPARGALAAEPLGGLLWGLHDSGQSVWCDRGSARRRHRRARGMGGRAARASRSPSSTPASTRAPRPRRARRARLRLRRGGRGPAGPQRARDPRGGTIAAGENGVGMVGVAPRAGVMPLRVLDAPGRATRPTSPPPSRTRATTACSRQRVARLGLPVARRAPRDPRPPGDAVRRRGRQRRRRRRRRRPRRAVARVSVRHERAEPGVRRRDRADDTRPASPTSARRASTYSRRAQNISPTWPRGRADRPPPVLRDGATATRSCRGRRWPRRTSRAPPRLPRPAARLERAQLKAALLDGADRLPAWPALAVTGGAPERGGDGADRRRAPRRPTDPGPALDRHAGAGRRAGRGRPAPAAPRAAADQPPAGRWPSARLAPPRLPGAGRDPVLHARRRGRRQRPAGAPRCARRPAAGARAGPVPGARRGATHWSVGPLAARHAAARGSWRVTLATSAGRGGPDLLASR